METPETSAGRSFAAFRNHGPPLLSIVVPAFNEAARIADSLKKIDAFIGESPLTFELIVVDDGSADNTADLASQFQIKELRVIRNSCNHGKGYTVRQGVLAATGK